jgi:hypothetical protein
MSEAIGRLAVLIDADNAHACSVGKVLDKVRTLGETIVIRIYGDFTHPRSASWRQVLQKHAIKPMQQYAYSTGKNATDSALIIDAMDLLYTRKFDGFCLITSDSDFTSLAMRMREENLAVYGFGKKLTPSAFKDACHQFFPVDELMAASAPLSAKKPKLVFPVLELKQRSDIRSATGSYNADNPRWCESITTPGELGLMVDRKIATKPVDVARIKNLVEKQLNGRKVEIFVSSQPISKENIVAPCKI